MNVKTLCLALIGQGVTTGYDIKKAVEEGPTGYFYHAGFGSIYPALNALEKDGLVACCTESQDGRPHRKVYALTPRGRQALVESMRAVATPSRLRIDALFQIFFSQYLDPGRAPLVADGYRAEMADRLAALEAEQNYDRGEAGQAFVHGLGLAVYRAIIDYIDDNRALLETAPAEVKEAS